MTDMEHHRFVFTGGGTGGHVYPNIAVYEALRDRYPEAEFLYIGTRRGSEARIVKSISQPLDFKAVPSRGMPPRLGSFSSLISLFTIFLGACKSFFILRGFRPDLIIGSGGYVSAPVLLAAALLKIKVFIHEQNSIPGRLNQFVARFAARIGVSFLSTAYFFPEEKVVFTGYPLRKSIQHRTGEDIRGKFKIPAASRVLFVFSGSMGARSINQAVTEIIPQLLALKDLAVIIATGKSYSREYKAYDETLKTLESIGIPGEIEGRLIIREYFDHIEDVYAIADLAIARAGAGSIKEIMAMGLPAILIPKVDVPADHQIMNAREMEKTGGARIIMEEMQTREEGRRSAHVPEAILFRTICETLTETDRLAGMKRSLGRIENRDGTGIIVREIESILRKMEKPADKQIRVFYLHSPREEKNYELLFDSNTVGNTFLTDIYLEKTGGDALFKIDFLNPPPEEEVAIIRRIKGRLAVNGADVARWSPLREGDRIGINEDEFQFNCYLEKIRELDNGGPAVSGGKGPSLGIILSRIGGFLHKVVMAAVFGVGKAMDIFSVGHAVVGYLQRVFAEDALKKAFLPVFLRLLRRGSRKKAWESAASIVNFSLALSLILSAAGIALTPILIPCLVPGLIAKGFGADLFRMTRLLFPYLFLATVVAVMTAILKAFRRFLLSESSAIFFAAGSIAGILLFRRTAGIYSLAYGILLGGLLQILFLLPFLIRILSTRTIEFSYRPTIRLRNAAGRKYGSQLVPITVDTVLSQTAVIVDKFFVSPLITGSLSYLYFAMGIFQIPFALTSRTIAAVMRKEFPESATLFDRKRTRRLFIDGININLFLLTPISILMIVLANPIVSLLLERFHFSASAVTHTALALQFYSLGLVGWGVHLLTTRIFTARLDRKTSLWLNFFMLIANTGLCSVLVGSPLKFAGAPLATSISFLSFSMIRMAVLKHKLVKEDVSIDFQDILRSMMKTMIAAILMMLFVFQAKFIFNRIHFQSRVLENLILTLSLAFVGVSTYFLASLILKNTGVLIFRKKSSERRKAIPPSLLSPFGFWDMAVKNPEPYRDEYRYKINLYLANPRWEIRNIGIKLIGLFKEKERGDFLIGLLQSGRECGFIRRNALQSLRELGLWDSRIRALLRRMLDDSYFEVRVAAFRYLSENMDSRDYPFFRDVIGPKFSRLGTEEKVACLKLIAGKGDRADLPLLEKLYTSGNSLIREELLELLCAFFRRGLLDARETMEQAGRILITSNHLRAEFRIKALMQQIRKETEKS